MIKEIWMVREKRGDRYVHVLRTLDASVANSMLLADDMRQLLADFAAWDKRYPKSSINPMKGERELDALFARSNALLLKTGESA